MSSQDIVRALQSNDGEVVKNVFLWGAIICSSIFGTFALTYLLAYAVDNWFTCCDSDGAVINSTQRTSRKKSKDIWLRLTPEERGKILKAVFEKRIFLYENKTSCRSDQVSAETDEEKGEPAVAFELADNVKPSNEATREITIEQQSSEGNSPLESPEIADTRESEAEINVLHDQEKDAVDLKEEQSDLTEDDQGGKVLEVDDADHERACCVCLNAYEEGNPLITGTQCQHIFHYACCMAWLNKNVQCPYCRRAMITEVEWLPEAVELLGPERVRELGETEHPHGTQPVPSGTVVVAVLPSSNVSTTSTSGSHVIDASESS